jgi:hypothetical protein
MTPFEIPLSPEPQKFNIGLAGTEYQVRLYWNKTDAAWYMDLNEADGTPLQQGIPLVTGIDLLKQYPHLGVGGSLVVQTDYNPDAVPTYDNLGTTGHLYFLTE